MSHTVSRYGGIDIGKGGIFWVLQGVALRRSVLVTGLWVWPAGLGWMAGQTVEWRLKLLFFVLKVSASRPPLVKIPRHGLPISVPTCIPNLLVAKIPSFLTHIYVIVRLPTCLLSTYTYTYINPTLLKSIRTSEFPILLLSFWMCKHFHC